MPTKHRGVKKRIKGQKSISSMSMVIPRRPLHKHDRGLDGKFSAKKHNHPELVEAGVRQLRLGMNAVEEAIKIFELTDRRTVVKKIQTIATGLKKLIEDNA